MKVSDFDVLKKMASESMGIKSSTNILGGDANSKGGVVKVGVDRETLTDMLQNKVLLILYVVDEKQFFELKKQMEE